MQYGAPISGAIDQPGPYYLILPNSTARFILSGSVSGTSLVRDTYYVQLDHFQPNYRITPYVLNVRTNSLALGDVEPIVVISPRSGDQLITGSTSTIRWSGNLGRAAQISLEGPSWYNVTEPDRQEAYANNEYDWNVGKVYSYNGTQWVISDMQPGRYRVIVRDYRSGVSSGSGYFTVADSAHMPPSVKVIIGSTTPSLSLIYDQAGGESRLAANFIVDLSAGSSDQMIGTSGYFSASMRNDTDTAFGYGSTAYDKPANVDLSLDGMMYVIHASTTARFNVRAEFNPQIMFAGTYRASLTGVSLTDDSSGWEYLTIPPNQTNAVTIIGEKSPYINSISPASANSNEQVTIDGLRFAASGNILTLYDEFPPEKGEKTTPTVLMVGSTNGGRTIKFVPNLPASRYWMTITDPVNGTSNGVDLTIQDTPLSIAFDNPTLISGQTVNMSFGIPNDLAAEKLYLSCPDGVFATWFKYGDHVSSGASEVCNTWVNFTPPSVRSLALVMSNYSSSTKTVSPNLYSYFKDNPTFAHGKAEVFTVAPAVTFSPSARPSIQVIYPNGGQEYDFFKSQVFVLNWATVNIPSTNKIRVNLNNEDTGVSYLISPGIDNDGSARLSVFAGRTLPAGRYSLELLSTVDNTGYYDLSDGYLNINPGATTTVPVVQTPATSTVPVNATSTSASGPSSKNPIVPVSNNTGGINGVSPIVSPTPSPSPSASPSFSPSPSPSSSPSPSPSASPSPSPSPSPIYSPSPSPSSSPVTNTRKGYQRATIWDALKTILGL